ncbi:hypothetical protein Psi02_76430 [Planotetraspora silvatica]|uniref:Uncharacterized protein n=1 Tax=Planotetraspora silvatica TaxID=234614 RepID=A0A8J3USM4_9ACTN|nr:hypothetical protein Psi02_76430 [Planotetraspora silvatica]
MKLVAVPFAHHDGERADVRGGLGQLRTAIEDLRESAGVLFLQVGGVSDDPSDYMVKGL